MNFARHAHVIFHQKYYSKTIEDRVRCKPCFYPVDPPGQNCGKCIRYLLPRKRDRILNIDFEKKLKPNITINLVGIDMSLSQYFVLEESLDKEEKRKAIFENYGQKDYFGSPEEVFREYENLARNKENYRSRYKNAILEVIKDADCDILLFPEYSIPLNIYNQIKEEIKQICTEKKCVIVAGSHIDEDGFNVCPVFIFRDDGGKGICEIYELYKNYFSPFEEVLKLMKNRGTAHLKFLNTIWGNIYIQICYDVFTVHGRFKNVDVLLIPNFNHSKSYKKTIKDKAQSHILVAGYANTTGEEELETDFFYPPRKAIPRDIKPLHKEQWPKGAKILEDEYLFSWDNYPRTDRERLLSFLRDDLDIGWVENAEIRKSDDGKTIRIFKDENSAEIMIEEKKEKATLKISDGRTYYLKVKKENGELNIYEEAIFKLSEEEKRVEEFNIKIKQLDFDLIQLDLIREVYSIRNANNR